MRNLIYAVATSLDNFIADPDGNIEMFPREGPHIEDYVEELLSYNTAIMGKNTYEFGYRHGLEEGAPLYPFMLNYVYSKSLHVTPSDESLKIINVDTVNHINLLKALAGTPLLLSGGGLLAGSLMQAGLIDELHLRVCPIELKEGIPLLGEYKRHVKLEVLSEKDYENGVTFVKYKVLK